MECRRFTTWIAVCMQMMLFVTRCGAACTWPTEFANNVFLDSMKGELTFTSTGMTGYSLTAHFTHTVNDWECSDNSYYASENLLIIRSTSTFFAFANWYTYICLHIQKITDVSYRYYHVQDQDSDAGQHRVYLVADTEIASKGKTDICNSAMSATGGEFGVLLLKGSEADAKITCPSMLLGRFNFTFTDAASVEQCASTADKLLHMNVCTNKTTLAFDEPCSQSIVYAAGEVHCVDAVTATDTYVALYNAQETVDGSTTYRFSCMAISADGTTATIVYNNCTNHQTSSYLARDFTTPASVTIIGGSITFTPYEGGCNWPTEFQGNTFYDNTQGSLVFTTTTMSGFSFTALGSLIQNWECLDETYWTSEKTLLLKATETFSHIQGVFVSYLCLKFTEVSAGNSYYYYQYHDAQTFTDNNVRVHIATDGTITSKATLCSVSSAVPNAAFHFIVKQSAVTTAKQYCPPSLLAKMGYVHTAVGGAATCDVSTSNWDVCTDRMVMTFNYTACNTQMAYSAAGEVWCMANITSTYEYVVVYNTDSSPTYRFACFVVSTDGTTASMVYDQCRENQTPTTLAQDGSGTDIGALITMTATETCPFVGATTPTPATSAAGASSEGSSIDIVPIVVGVLVGVLGVAAIVAVTIYCIKKKKRIAHGDSEKQKPPDGVVSNGHTPGMTVEEMDNPALTANPQPNTLTPIPHPGVSDTHPPALPPISKPDKV